MAPYLFRWRSRPDIAQLEHTVDQLRMELIKLRREMSNKEQYIGRLKVLCHERTTRIDNLRATIDDLRAANQCRGTTSPHSCGCRETTLTPSHQVSPS